MLNVYLFINLEIKIKRNERTIIRETEKQNTIRKMLVLIKDKQSQRSCFSQQKKLI